MRVGTVVFSFHTLIMTSALTLIGLQAVFFWLFAKIVAIEKKLLFPDRTFCAIRPLVTFTPFALVGAIFALTGLDYLGYGLPAPTPSWGELIDQALRLENRDKLWLTFAPFSAITITLILVVFIGESVREAFDPKQYARYE